MGVVPRWFCRSHTLTEPFSSGSWVADRKWQRPVWPMWTWRHGSWNETRYSGGGCLIYNIVIIIIITMRISLVAYCVEPLRTWCPTRSALWAAALVVRHTNSYLWMNAQLSLNKCSYLWMNGRQSNSSPRGCPARPSTSPGVPAGGSGTPSGREVSRERAKYRLETGSSPPSPPRVLPVYMNGYPCWARNRLKVSLWRCMSWNIERILCSAVFTTLPVSSFGAGTCWPIRTLVVRSRPEQSICIHPWETDRFSFFFCFIF